MGAPARRLDCISYYASPRPGGSSAAQFVLGASVGSILVARCVGIQEATSAEQDQRPSAAMAATPDEAPDILYHP